MRVDLPVLRIKADFLAELTWLAGDPRNPVYWMDFLKAERALKIELLENPVSQHRVESLWDKHIANDDEIRAIFSYVHDLAKMYAVLSLSVDKPSILISVLKQKEVKMLHTEQDVVAAIGMHFQQLQREERVGIQNGRRDRFQPKANDDEQALSSDAGCSAENDREEEECGIPDLRAVAGLFRIFGNKAASKIRAPVDQKLVEHFKNASSKVKMPAAK